MTKATISTYMSLVMSFSLCYWTCSLDWHTVLVFERIKWWWWWWWWWWWMSVCDVIRSTLSANVSRWTTRASTWTVLLRVSLLRLLTGHWARTLLPGLTPRCFPCISTVETLPDRGTRHRMHNTCSHKLSLQRGICELRFKPRYRNGGELTSLLLQRRVKRQPKHSNLVLWPWDTLEATWFWRWKVKGQGHRVSKCIFHLFVRSITEKQMIPKCWN